MAFRVLLTRYFSCHQKRAFKIPIQGTRSLIGRLGASQVALVAAYGKGERDDVPRLWLLKLKEAFDLEQG